MELLTARLRLREFAESDFDGLRSMETRAELNTYERQIPSEAEIRRELDEAISSQHEVPRTNYKLAITLVDRDDLLGVVKLSRQQEAVREWEVGWAIHPVAWNQGYATEAATKVLDWAFCELKIHRVVAFCHADNKPSTRVMEKLGMKKEGRLRDVRWLNGYWWDELVYGILEREWLENQQACSMEPMRL